MVSFAGAALLTTMVAIILRVIHRHIYNNDDAMPDESIEQRLEQLVKAFKDALKHHVTLILKWGTYPSQSVT